MSFQQDEQRRRELLGLVGGEEQQEADPRRTELQQLMQADEDEQRREELLRLSATAEPPPPSERTIEGMRLARETEDPDVMGSGFAGRVANTASRAGLLPEFLQAIDTPTEQVRFVTDVGRLFILGDQPSETPADAGEAFNQFVDSIPVVPRLFSGMEGGRNLANAVVFAPDETAERFKERPFLTAASLGLDVLDVLPLPLAVWGGARRWISPTRAAAKLADEAFETTKGFAAVADEQLSLFPSQTSPTAVASTANAVDAAAAARRTGEAVDDVADTMTDIARQQMQLPGIELQGVRNGYGAAEAGVVRELPNIPPAGQAIDEAAAAVIVGDLPTPFAGVPVALDAVKDPVKFVESLQDALKSRMAALNMNGPQRTLFQRTFHGGAGMSTDPLVLKRQLEYTAEVLAGRQHVPMTLKEARQVRKQWGPRVLEEPSGKQIISDLAVPKKGEDAVRFAFRPYSKMVEDGQDIGFFRQWTGQLFKSVPEADRILRPKLDAMYGEMAEYANRWNPLMLKFGIRPGSEASARIARLLNGDAGDIKQFVDTTDATGRQIPGKKVIVTRHSTRPVKPSSTDPVDALRAEGMEVVERTGVPEPLTVTAQSGGRFTESIIELADDGLPILRPTAVHAIPSEFTPTEVRIAALARMDLDNLWVALNGVMPEGLAYNKAYITFIREQYQKGGILDEQGNVLLDLSPPDIVRNTGRRNWLGFTKRTSNEVPEDLDFVTSMQAYIPAALRKIHMDPALAELDELTATFRNAHGTRGVGLTRKAALTQKAKHYLLGTPTDLERSVDAKILEVVSHPIMRRVLESELAQSIPTVQALTSRRPSMRLSVQLSSGLYRGILGGNISASVNNMTQSVNTMAREGVFPTIDGMQQMMGQRGRDLATKAKLTNEFSKVFQEIQPGLVSWSGGRIKNLDDVLFAPFEFAENMNRGIGFHAGFGRAIRAGATTQDAMMAGRLAANETQFVYDLLGKNMLFRGPFARQLGVLTSFPLKQTEFLREALTRDQMVLARYLLVTGFAQRLANANGLAIDPFESLMINGQETLPGTSFLRQVEGAVSGQQDQSILDIAPATSLVRSGFVALGMLAGLHPDSNDPRKFSQHVQNFFTGVSNAIVPGAVQLTEAARVAGNIAQIQDTRPEGTSLLDTETLGDVSRPTSNVPIAREFGPRSGRLSRRSTPVEEVMRAVGLTPVKQKQQQIAYGRLSSFINRDRGEAALANEIALYYLQNGKLDEARQTLIDGGVSPESFQAFRQGAPMSPLLRQFDNLSQADAADFMEAYPDTYEFVMEQIRQERLVRRERR